MTLIQKYQPFLFKVHTLLLIAIVISLPWSIKINSIFIILATVVSIVIVFNIGIKFSWEQRGLIGFFILSLISLTYSYHLDEGLFKIEKRLALLAVPIILGSVRSVPFGSIIKYFTFSCIALTAFLFLSNIIEVLQGVDNADAWHYSHFTKRVNIHPAYLALYLVFIHLYYLNLSLISWKRLSIKKKTVLFTLLIYLMFFIFFLQARMALVILITGSLLLIFTSNGKQYFLKLSAVVLTIVICGLLFVRAQYFYNRFLDTSDDLHFRINQWKAATCVFIQNPLIGVGVGDSQYELDLCYLTTDLELAIDRAYNTHNQYLDILISNGLLGLLIWIIMLLYSVRYAWATNNFYLLSFIFLIAVAFITENLLNTQKGIVFFSLFYCLLHRDEKNHPTTT